MKRIIAIAFAMLFATLHMNAQKVGYIDTEKILSAIPAYRSAQSQLESLSRQYQDEIEREYDRDTLQQLPGSENEHVCAGKTDEGE